ncbi:hypothetical protein [Mycoplasmoides genitalium]|uniref:hypothetical protein n=1 Tax=Mycoplasmoides genitalium TaxID=2097 RepID=UPI0002D36BE5|nr:hypothetical protein [Mycoplasmoides genitalium]
MQKFKQLVGAMHRWVKLALLVIIVLLGIIFCLFAIYGIAQVIITIINEGALL